MKFERRYPDTNEGIWMLKMVSKYQKKASRYVRERGILMHWRLSGYFTIFKIELGKIIPKDNNNGLLLVHKRIIGRKYGFSLKM